MENTALSHSKLEVEKVSRALLVPLFAAASLYLSSIEYLLPRPVPFFRFGLANIAILVVLRHFTLRDLCILVMLKVLGLGILNGTIASYVFVFSLLGSLSGLMCMYTMSRLSSKHITLVGISLVGAVGSNAVQILCAVFYVFGSNAWIIAPYLLMLGIASGYVVGGIAQHFTNTSDLLPRLMQNYKPSEPLMEARAKKATNNKGKVLSAPSALLICGIITSIAYIASSSLLTRCIQVLFFFLAARSVKRIKVLYFCTLIISVTCFALLIPNGKVLFSVGSFAITQGALHSGLFRALTLCGYVFLSLWCISPQLNLPGTVGSMLTKTLSFFYLFWEQVTTHPQHSGAQTQTKRTLTNYAETMTKRVMSVYAESHTTARIRQQWQKTSSYARNVSWYYGVLSLIIAYASLLVFE